MSTTRCLAGKPVLTYPHSGRSWMPSNLRALLGKHPTVVTLRQLGEISGRNWTSPHDGFIGGAPIPPHAIPYLALLSIECSNDYRGSPMNDAGFRKLGAMFMDLVDPSSGTPAEDWDSAVGLFLRLSRQFEFQGELRHQLPRIVLILRDIWPTVTKAKDISPCDDLVRITGVTLDQLLLFGWAFAQEGAKGWLQPFREGPKYPQFSLEAQAAFLRWASADYKTIRQLTADGRANLSDERLDPYRFNPLVRFPLVRPDVQPIPQTGDVYLVPCQRWLFARVHGGLFHLLADHHRGEGTGENAFRVAFGHVFQAYVGKLLQQSLGSNAVIAERRYRDDGVELDTVDWIIVEGGVGVLVEVKQASLSFQARGLGDTQAAKADLKKTVVKAVRQLKRTENAVRSGVRGLEDLGNIEFERLVVLYDTLPFENSILRDYVANELVGAPHAHVCSVDELEYALGLCRTEKLYELLRRKRLGPEGQDSMDFRDWLSFDVAAKTANKDNAFLKSKYREIMCTWGVANAAAALG